MRLFVAVDLPETVKEQLVRLYSDIPTARWSSRQQMHLTLFFIGETGRLTDIDAVLKGVQAAPFEMAITGVGRFPPQDRQPARVLWAGVEVSAGLRILHAQVTAALIGLGFEADGRPFSPHITLARLKTERRLPQLDAFLDEHRTLRTDSFPTTEFVLFSSELSREGARYHREGVYPLKTG